MTGKFPREKVKVTTPCGWRKDPHGRAHKKHHNGVDLVGPAGGPVQSIARGKVIFAGPSTRKKADGTVGGFGYHEIGRAHV